MTWRARAAVRRWRPPPLGPGSGENQFLDRSGGTPGRSVRTLPPLPDAPYRSRHIFDFQHLQFKQASGLTRVRFRSARMRRCRTYARMTSRHSALRICVAHLLCTSAFCIRVHAWL